MDDCQKYIEGHSTPQTAALDWVGRQTNVRTNHARMLTGKAQGRLIKMIADMIRPENILEIGTFTGYSAICLGMALPPDGHLITLEINDELEDIIRGGLDRAGLSGKVSLILGDAKISLQKLREKVLAGELKPFDLVYIDANKREYPQYYELVFDMVHPGGYILADNVLWDGKVWQDPLPQDKQTLGIAAFNDIVAADPRVESVIVPIRDGLNLIRKL